MSWRDCPGFYDDGVMNTRCTAQAGCGLLGCPFEKSLNDIEIKGPTQPIKIGASIPVSLLREKFLTDGVSATIKLGRELFGDALSDAQIIAIGRKEATLRGWTSALTYHDQPCVTCKGCGFLNSNTIDNSRYATMSDEECCATGYHPREGFDEACACGYKEGRPHVNRTEACPTCEGDGFAPPIKRTETEKLRRKVGR